MTKKIWKLTPETIDFIIEVAPTAQKAIELICKAHMIFNCDQSQAQLTIAQTDKPFGPEAKLFLWRSDSAELVDAPDDFEEPWDDMKKMLDALDDGEKKVNVHVVVFGGDDDEEDVAEEAKKGNE